MIRKILWNNKHILKSYKLNNLNWTKVLEKYGVVLLNNIKPNVNYMNQISTILESPIFDSIYGNLWDTGGQIGKPTQDKAYTTEYLPPHTDLNYNYNTPKYQIFCCEKQAFIGGETILVDGLFLKNLLKEINPIEYKFLTEKLYTFRCSDNIYQDKKKIFSNENIHHNHGDMIPTTDREYHIWNDLTLNKNFSINYLLNPKETLIINNHRILHGRNSFKGNRNMIGCYLNNEPEKESYNGKIVL